MNKLQEVTEVYRNDIVSCDHYQEEARRNGLLLLGKRLHLAVM